MIEHQANVRRVLRAAGMSERSELTAEERRRLPKAATALSTNPSIGRERLYRILRPRGEEDA